MQKTLLVKNNLETKEKVDLSDPPFQQSSCSKVLLGAQIALNLLPKLNIHLEKSKDVRLQ